ncbi:ribosomal silencing factor RsfA [Geminocystis sp. NIES-3708]|uniref:ribosome silencing factor n=1 Tax=Geminocystis sp. NIES-3708 TaxID=1615909 RepID=UPI0005FCCB3F|nr:ribosome silencing factor [Geminocystis sp. NIES-3708]BAQ61598.1 ribosomal silencing factor RsfA [Geminocystis sp. NIES-3708]
MTKSHLHIENYSTEQKINQPTSSSISSQEFALMIADAADDRKANNIILLNVEKLSYLADYFVIMTGFSQPQLRAISMAIEDKVYEKLHRLPTRIEGKNEGNWILHDYGDVIAHIFLPEARDFYDLEAFWGSAERTIFQSK